MYYKGHGEVNVDIMLLLVANNCWTRSFALGYWLFYFSSVFDSDEERRPLQVKDYLKWVYMLPCLPLPILGTVYFCDSWYLYCVEPTYCWNNHGEAHYMNTCLVFAFNSVHNTLRGVIMISFDSTLSYFGCLLFLARSARFDVTGWYVHTFSVHHGFCCLFWDLSG
jgi:hypothetical protein